MASVVIGLGALSTWGVRRAEEYFGKIFLRSEFKVVQLKQLTQEGDATVVRLLEILEILYSKKDVLIALQGSGEAPEDRRERLIFCAFGETGEILPVYPENQDIILRLIEQATHRNGNH